MEARFYMCRSCRNQVLSSENYIFTDKILRAIIGKNVVNVQVGDVQHDWLYPVVDVSCRRCGENLGYKFAENVAEINQVIKKGNFILSQFKVVYVDTEQPVETQQPVEN